MNLRGEEVLALRGEVAGLRPLHDKGFNSSHWRSLYFRGFALSIKKFWQLT
jgi:hypothetical protein